MATDNRAVTPDLYLPLADVVLAKWGRWTYFLGRARESLRNDREDLEADVARAQVGWRLWTERREDLRRWAESQATHPVDDEQLEDWWLRSARGETAGWDGYWRGQEEHSRTEFTQALGLTQADLQVIQYHPDMHEPVITNWLLTWLHWNLVWVDDLDQLRTLAQKSWPANPRDRRAWSQDELSFVNAFFEEQQPVLMAPDETGPIDPFEIEVFNEDQNLGFGLDGLRYVMYVLMRATVVDFADSIIEKTRRPTARGSLSCIECGRFVGRRALGYGQLYCSERCKKRAAKRRYRARLPGPHGSVLRSVK